MSEKTMSKQTTMSKKSGEFHTHNARNNARTTRTKIRVFFLDYNPVPR